MNKDSTKKKINDQSDSVTIDIQPFITPIAIVVGAIIISVSLLLGMNSIDVESSSNITGSTVSDNSENTIPSGNNDAPAEANPAATTTIDDDPVLGDRDKAKVAIVEFSDYECPFCKRHHTETFPQIKEQYIDTGKVAYVFRDFPLNFHDPLASQQAMAAECIQELGGDKKYYDYNDKIFETTSSNGKGMTKDQLYTLAKDVGVDSGEFKTCLDEERYKEEVINDIADGGTAGVSGTPGFIIGVLNEDGSVDGVNISGAQPFSVFEQVIEEQLERVN